MATNNPLLHDPQDPTDSSLIAGQAHDELTGHEYDGIQEYDNPLPGWWKWLFVFTIVICFPYWAYYHFGATGRTVIDQYSIASAEVARLLFAEMGELKPDRATLVKFMTNDSGLSVGQSIFKANCISCHGNEGAGNVGPNLTDEEYKNIKQIEDILNVINKGAGGGAMPAWQNRLGETERILVSSYVASLRGSLPPGTGKAPEGRPIAPWPSPSEVAPDADAGEEGSAEADPNGSAEAGANVDTDPSANADSDPNADTAPNPDASANDDAETKADDATAG
jgi:cytochrome c oxidase cbb3-type subunit 3